MDKRIHDLNILITHYNFRRKLENIKQEITTLKDRIFYYQNSFQSDLEKRNRDIVKEIENLKENKIQQLEYLRIQPFEESELYKNYSHPTLRNINLKSVNIFRILLELIVVVIVTFMPFAFIINWFTSSSLYRGLYEYLYEHQYYNERPEIVEYLNKLTTTKTLDEIVYPIATILFVIFCVLVVLIFNLYKIRSNSKEKKLFKKDKEAYDAEVNRVMVELQPYKEKFEEERELRLSDANNHFDQKIASLKTEIESNDQRILNIPQSIIVNQDKLENKKLEFQETYSLYENQKTEITIPSLVDNDPVLGYVIKLLQEERANSTGEAYNIFETNLRHYQRMEALQQNNDLAAERNAIETQRMLNEEIYAREANRIAKEQAEEQERYHDEFLRELRSWH